MSQSKPWPAMPPEHPSNDPGHREQMTLNSRYARAAERCRKMRDAWPPFTPEQAEKLALILTGQIK